MKVLVTQTQNRTGQTAFYIANKKHTLNNGFHAFLGLNYSEYLHIISYLYLPPPAKRTFSQCKAQVQRVHCKKKVGEFLVKLFPVRAVNSQPFIKFGCSIKMAPKLSVSGSVCVYLSIEDWIIYRGPGFLPVVWFGSTLTPSPLSPQKAHTGRLRKRGKLLTGEGVRGWAWSRIIYGRKKEWPSINYSTLWYEQLLQN